MRDCRIKHGQSVAQKMVRNMTTKDNPGTLPMNFYSTERPKSQPFDFGKIGEVQGETTETVVTASGRERGRKEGSSELVQSSGDIVCLASDISSCEMKLYGSVRIAARCNYCYQKSKGNVLSLMSMCSIG